MKNSDKPLPGIDVLNTGYGDFELRFNPNEPDEVQKAKETITDMLKRGYAIFVRQGEETFRVRKFDVDRNVYIIGSTPAEEVPIAEAKAIAVGRSAGVEHGRRSEARNRQGPAHFGSGFPLFGGGRFRPERLVRIASSRSRVFIGA